MPDPTACTVSGIRGGPRPAMLKLSISLSMPAGKLSGTLVYSWPQALEKARAADRIVRQRLAATRACNSTKSTPNSSASMRATAACAVPNPDPPEVQLRIGVRGQDRDAVDRFTREMIPLVLTGPPGGTGFGEGRPPVREIVAYWPALIPREEIQTSRGGGGMKIPLSRIAHTRSGDKGDTSNIGVIALTAAVLSDPVREVTPERVKHFFGELVKGNVERFELPNLDALNFLLHEALGGGGTLSLRIDAQGKTLGAALLRMEIEVSES